MIRKILGLILLAGLCSSCGAKIANTYGAIDQSKLANKEGKYGVVISRTMFFDDSEQMDMFYHDNSSVNLDDYNNLNINAKEISGKEDGLLYAGYSVGGTWRYTDDEKKKKNLFSIVHEVRSFSKGFTSAVLKPEYFYTLKMLPEGEYYVSQITISYHYNKNLLQEFNKKESPYHFSVKAGYINYIGDFYLSSPKKDKGFFSNTYSLNGIILNQSDKAKTFVEKYHPEINLPFTVNLIQRSSR